jgi:membrane protein
VRNRVVALRERLERLLLWRVWERLLEIEFIDRSVALAGKAFVSFFPLVIVVAAFVPERTREGIIRAVTLRLGIRGDALTITEEAFASSDDLRKATGVLGLVLTILFATSFATALQRVYVRAWRRPPASGVGAYGRGIVCLLAALVAMALLGGLANAVHGGLAIGVFAVLGVAVSAGLWWFAAWFLLMGDVRARVLVPTGVITALTTVLYSMSASVWMPKVVTDNEAQFGLFGVALALVTWFSGAAICILIGTCAGAVFAEDSGSIGTFIRGSDDSTLTRDARPSFPPPVRELTLRNAFQSNQES